MALLLIATGRWPSGQRPGAVVPIRIHASAGWGQPAVGGATVFYLSKAHQLFAVDRADGAERWRRPLPDGVTLTAGSVVVLSDDTVIAGDGDVFAFDARTGDARWHSVHDPHGVPGQFLGPAQDGVVFAGAATGLLTAWYAATGQQRWQTRVSGVRVTMFAPVVDDEIVVAAFTDFGMSPRSGGVVAVDARSGQQRWLTKFPRTSAVLPASAAGRPALTNTLVAAASSDGTVYVLSRATGLVRWTIPPPLSPVALTSRVVHAKTDAQWPLTETEHEDFRNIMPVRSTLVITSLTGMLTAVDVATRQVVWQYASPAHGSSGFGLTMHGETAYIPFASGRVLGLDAHTGYERRVIGGSQRRFDWPPVAADDRLYLTAEDGLYVVDIE